MRKNSLLLCLIVGRSREGGDSRLGSEMDLDFQPLGTFLKSWTSSQGVRKQAAPLMNTPGQPVWKAALVSAPEREPPLHIYHSSGAAANERE